MRRHKAEKRELTPDVKYNSEMVSMTINIVMRGGKKSTAQKIVYGALDIIKEKKGLDPLEVFLQALENTKPRLEAASVVLPIRFQWKSARLVRPRCRFVGL